MGKAQKEDCKQAICYGVPHCRFGKETSKRNMKALSYNPFLKKKEKLSRKT